MLQTPIIKLFVILAAFTTNERVFLPLLAVADTTDFYQMPMDTRDRTRITWQVLILAMKVETKMEVSTMSSLYQQLMCSPII